MKTKKKEREKKSIPEITQWLYGLRFFLVGAVVHLD